MDKFVSEIVDRMLRFRRSRPESTRRFRRLEHDRDILPAFQRQLERVMESYGKLSPIAYDMQGIRDEGVDIGIRQQNDAGEYESLIGFQIKSVRDLLEKHYMQKLKGQHFDSSKIKNLQQYYIVLCVDEEGNKGRLRMIEAEFKDTARTKVIEPTYADFFLSLSQERIDAYIYRTLTAGDIVLKKAFEIVNFPIRTTGALVIYLTAQSFIESSGPVAISTIKDSGIFQDFHRKLLDKAEAAVDDYEGDDQNDDAIEFDERSEVASDFESQVEQDIETISDDIVTVDGDLIAVRFEQVTPLIALATDA